MKGKEGEAGPGVAAGQGVPGDLERGQAPDVLPNQMLVWMEMRDRSQGRLH